MASPLTLTKLRKKIMNRTKREITFKAEYQNYIDHPPVSTTQMYGGACSNDEITISTWRPTWMGNVEANKKFFGEFKNHGIGKLYGEHKYKPAILAGSGPSLAYNGERLKNRGGIPLISCLHNYHFFEDRGIKPDYYVTLDAGDVVLEEVSEGGKKTPDEYWESTKDKTLVAFIGSTPKLFEKWKGKVYLFAAPVPDKEYIEHCEKLEKFNSYISTGGNVLGACLYFAKAVLGCNPIAFVGADFAFSYDKKFHGWDSKYDKHIGQVLAATDVFGNKIFTWQSYFNFKSWFDYVAITVPGIYVNCTEGGIFGAYTGGNIRNVLQSSLEDFINMFELSEAVKNGFLDPESDEKKILF